LIHKDNVNDKNNNSKLVTQIRTLEFEICSFRKLVLHNRDERIFVLEVNIYIFTLPLLETEANSPALRDQWRVSIVCRSLGTGFGLEWASSIQASERQVATNPVLQNNDLFNVDACKQPVSSTKGNFRYYWSSIYDERTNITYRHNWIIWFWLHRLDRQNFILCTVYTVYVDVTNKLFVKAYDIN